MVNKAFSLLFVMLFSVSGCASQPALGFSDLDSSANDDVQAQEIKTITFSIVPPDVSEISSQQEITPFLKTENDLKIPLPTDVPIYLRSGQQVDASYIGLRGYTVDVVCGSFENLTFKKIEKIIVNQTHEEVDPYVFYYCDVHSFNNYFYFTVDTKGKEKYLDGNYILDFKWGHPYYHLLAGHPTFGKVNHISYLTYLQLENGDVIGAQKWDYGPILTK